MGYKELFFPSFLHSGFPGLIFDICGAKEKSRSFLRKVLIGGI